MFLLVLTGFLNVPHNQWRAALALGASPARAFFQIVLPLSLPVLLVAVLIRAIETFKIFDVVYILTRGGPRRNHRVHLDVHVQWSVRLFSDGLYCRSRPAGPFCGGLSLLGDISAAT